MKLNSGFVRTLITSLVLLLAVATVGSIASAKEIRIFPVTAPFPLVCAGLNSGCDLVRAAAGLPPLVGPDAGLTPEPGDVLVLAPGTYAVVAPGGAPPFDGTGPVVIPGTNAGIYATAIAGGFGSGKVMENLEIRSRNGSTVTVISGTAGIPNIIVAADNVTIGGDTAEEGLTVQNAGADGIVVGDPGLGGLYAVPGGLAQGSQADEDVTIQNSFIQQNVGSGVLVVYAGTSTPRAVENFRFETNEFRLNGEAGIAFAPSVLAVGGSSEDEGLFFTRNTFDSNGQIGLIYADGLNFDTEGDMEQVIIQENQFLRNGDNGVAFGVTDADFDGTVLSQIENLLFEGNIIQQNGFQTPLTFGAGVVFANNGQIEDTLFIGNRDPQFREGISGNAGSGVLIASSALSPAGVPAVTGLPSLGVQDIDNLMFSDNVINENGQGIGLVGLPPFVVGGPVPFDGVTFLNQGDLDPVTFANNDVRLNGGSGITIGVPGNIPNLYAGFPHPGDFDNNEIKNNNVRNNGSNLFFPYGDGFAVVAASDINNDSFVDNTFQENWLHGVFLASTQNDINRVSFLGNNQFVKNGLLTGSDGVELSTFADISDVVWEDGQSIQNGGSGFIVDANGNTLGTAGYGFMLDAGVGALTSNLGDLTDVDVRNGTFNFNGSSAPIGSGDGILFLGDKVTDVVGTGITAETNDDHGALITSTDDVSNVEISDSAFNNNDRNNDTVGTGLFVDSNDDMDNVSAINVTANGNQTGIQYAVKGENGRDLNITDSAEINFNDKEGILINGSDDLADVTIANNMLQGNGIGITLRSVDRGSGLSIDSNRVLGDNGKGIGILLEAIGTDVQNNTIRNNLVGIRSERSQGSTINNNNIARNEDFGIDALGLKPGETIDATNNWWAEPSGPKHSSNPGGIGDRVTDKVTFAPFAPEPFGETLAEFEITEFSVPDTAAVGEEAQFSVTVQNTGSEEGTQNLTFKVLDSGNLVNSSGRTITLDPVGSTTVTFGFTFLRGGTFTVEVSTQDASDSAQITVTGATGLTIESVCDANSNSRIDDDEVLTCIGFWVSGEEVPGTGQTINDAKILFLIELWVTGGDISTLPASAAQAAPANWVEALFESLFSSTVGLTQHASATEVAPGDSFTVTTSVNTNDTVQGLLLSEQLPAGWTISEATTSGGFFKPSQNKWLWLNSRGTTVTYTVTVPADAANGSYTLNASADTADGQSGFNALNVRVSNPQTLSLNRVAFSGSRFVAEGTGITDVSVQVYSLSGSLVFSGSNASNTLSFDNAAFANGVYLYVVTANGANGQTVRSSVGKLVVLR